jgi:signal transduction histidine kinase
MALYLMVPLLACLALGVCATVILVHAPRDRANRLAALLVGGACIWAFCEVLWNVQSDPEVALALVRASALGWMFIGPLMLDLCLQVTGAPAPRVRRLRPWFFALMAALLVATWTTPWVQRDVLRTSWGWSYRTGPLYPLYYGLTLACVMLALGIGWREYRRAASPAERAQGRLLAIGLAFPLLIASLTDGILPMLGLHPMRLGTLSFCVLAGAISWSLHRYGFSLLAPGAFASTVLETLPEGVAMLRLDGRIRSANRAMAHLLGGEPALLPTLCLTDRIVDLPADFADGVSELRCELVRLDDRRIPVSISATRMRDRRGASVGVVLAVRDLAEVTSLRNRLELSGRLAAVGQLAAGIAHEINNPLAYVRANLGALRQDWQALGVAWEKRDAEPAGPPPACFTEGEELIDESIAGVDRAAAIVREVRSLSHASGAAHQPAALNALLEGVLRLASPELRDRIRVETRFGPEVRLHCAPQELQQVFLNLVLNAAQAIEGHGTIRVASELTGAGVAVRVEDDGCGIPAELLDRIFDPFFTTKAVGEGTGLGLGIAYEIVRRHRGEIGVSSEPGRGACFRVTLPLDVDTLVASS